jgi:hypothetical protein
MFIFSKIKEYILYATVVFSVVGGVFLRGFFKGKKAEQDKNRELENKAIEARKEIDEKVSKASDSELDRIASKWMRDK